MTDRILDLIRDIPVGTIIFLGILAWSFLGRSKKKPRPAQFPPHSTYASDERHPREEPGQYSGLEFGHQEDRYNDSHEWGSTKYGLGETDWGDTFDEDRDDTPRIR